MPRPSAEDRLRRILAVVPWVAAEDGPTIAEVCARFGYASERELQEELDLLFMCGVPPYTPDALIEVDVADGRVWIRYADWFSRPLRLTPAEALTLVAGSSALTEGEIDTPLARGLAKLAAALGVDDDVVDVNLGPEPSALATLKKAADEHRQVEIDYYAFGRDEITTRLVDPYMVFRSAGQWYLSAYCHRAEDDRLFRVDRVRRAEPQATAAPHVKRPDEPPPVFEPAPGDPTITLDLEPPAAWVASQYPTKSVEHRDDVTRVELYVSGEAWLARLLVRLGPDARVVDGDGSAGPRAAARILARYQDG